MSADTLRRAAALLRERAEDAGSATMWFDADVDLRNALRGTFGCYDAGNADVAADARWIATMHPGVGLAIADWLEWVSARRVPFRHALAVARQILGEAS